MNDLKIGKLVTLIGAGIALVFSFLPWASYSGYGVSVSRSAWSSGLFPMASWSALFAIVVGFLVAAEMFQFIKLPEKIWEFTLEQVNLVLSIFALLITLSYLIMDKGGASIGFGLMLSLLGTIGMVAGYFVDKLGIGANPNAGIPGQQGGFPGATTPGFPPPGQSVPPMPPQGAPPVPPQAAPPVQPTPPPGPTGQPPTGQPGTF